MAAGDFSNSQMYPIIEAASRMWDNSRHLIDQISEIESVRAIAENQRVNLNPVLINGSCVGYEIAWLKGTDITAAVIGDMSDEDCKLTGPELESVKKTYGNTVGRHAEFTVWDDECKGVIEYAEKIAEGLMIAMKKIKDAINGEAVAFLNANLQANGYTTGVGTVSGTSTFIDPTLWNADIIGQLALIAQMNRISDVVTLTGTNLWVPMFNAPFNALNMDQKDQLAKLSYYKRWYADPFTVDQVVGSPATFLWDRGAIAFYTKNDYQNEAPKMNNDELNTITYNIPDKDLKFLDGGQLRPARYDVNSQVLCKTMANGRKRFGRVFQLLMNYQFISSPAPIVATQTGILKVINGTAPTT